MKTEFTEAQCRQIRQAKKMLRHLWERSELKPPAILEALAEKGLMVKNSTLSTWLSLKEGNTIRPKQEALMPLIEIFCPEGTAEQKQELLLEISGLLGYQERPISSEDIRNRLSEQMDDSLKQTLLDNQADLELHLHALELLWEEIEPAILEYDKGFPVIRVEKDNLPLLRKLMGPEREAHKAFLAEEGYEIPLSRVQSLHALTEIINLLNEGSRVLHALVERNLVDEGYLTLHLARVEELVSYIWEISDRLLNNNLLCKTVPQLKKSLVRVMAVAGGIRFLLHNQSETTSDILFEKILACKGKSSEAEIKCAVAVFLGILARQYLQQKDLQKLKPALTAFDKATATLSRYHPKLGAEQELFYYKKELANLCFDVGSLLLWRTESGEIALEKVQSILKQAYGAYEAVLTSPNLFFLGLSEQRASHIRAFYLISLCWSCANPKKATAEIHKMASGEQLNERFWFLQLAKTIAWSVLNYRFGKNPENEFHTAALSELQRALLVPGLIGPTRQEIASDWILNRYFAQLKF
ncbi:MAG: hypothetical protein AB7I41_08355 [Candidatus Sericytochromatia bacterium]